MFFTLIVLVYVCMFGDVCGMNREHEQSLPLFMLPSIKQKPLQRHTRSNSVPDMLKAGDNYDEKELKVLACSCPLFDEKDIKDQVVFKEDKDFTSPLFTATKNLIVVANAHVGEAEIEDVYAKFKIALINQRRCIRCLTITLHLVLRGLINEQQTVHLAQKLILHGAVVNSCMERGDWLDSFTPLHWAKHKKFNSLEQILTDAGAKTDIMPQPNLLQLLVIID